MNDVMVSVRMPASLLHKLKELSKEQDFLDLSELVRSIAREKWVQHSKPQLFELKKLREDIELQLKKKSMERVQDEVNKELEKIKSKLKEGGLFE